MDKYPKLPDFFIETEKQKLEALAKSFKKVTGKDIETCPDCGGIVGDCDCEFLI